MSVLVALRRGDTIYMGADTQSTRGDLMIKSKKESNLKIHRYKNGLLLGHVGTLKTSFNVYTQSSLFESIFGRLTKKYIVTKIIPRIIERLRDKGLIDLKTKTMDSEFVIAYRDRLFKICDDFKVVEGDALAIGSGESSSFPYLLDNDREVNDIIIRSLRASASVNLYVSGPFVTINSKDLIFNFIE